ncbi:MAG: hypothetical protein O3C43_16615 [Verrucomicrobia bacterium]|nr:hypothetical protein [Verrucomicrobiota bacterium]
MKTKMLCHISAWMVLFTFLFALNAEETKTDPATGLIIADNWKLVATHCMLCHSTKGFTAVRLDRNNWEKIIRMMQEKNGLWQLGDIEPKILDYLETNYGLSKENYNPKIRRPLLD